MKFRISRNSDFASTCSIVNMQGSICELGVIKSHTEQGSRAVLLKNNTVNM